MTAPKTQKVSVRLKDNRLTQRYRAGIRVTLNTVNVDVDKEQLEALNNDPYILVGDPIGEKPVENGDESPQGDTNEGDEGSEGDEPTGDEGDEETLSPEEAKKKLLKENKLDDLRKMADESGIEFTEEDTKSILADAILEADNSTEE